MNMRYSAAIAAICLCLCAPSAASAQQKKSEAPDSVRLMHTIGVLAHDSMQGRRVGTPGSAKARAFLIGELTKRGVKPFDGKAFPQEFRFFNRRTNDTTGGTNLIGIIKGSKYPSKYIVVSAHYDHLGVNAAGDVFNGADDNASGTAGVLEVASYFAAHKPEHSIIVALFDAEESGDRGSHAYVASTLIPPKDSIIIDINLDMVGRNVKNELYAAGTTPYPFLLPYVEAAQKRAGLTLLTGHDGAPGKGDNWTNQSDQGAFNDAHIPFLYFGEEDHPDYHKVTDEIPGIMPGFYIAAVRIVLDIAKQVDAKPPTRPATPQH